MRDPECSVHSTYSRHIFPSTGRPRHRRRGEITRASRGPAKKEGKSKERSIPCGQHVTNSSNTGRRDPVSFLPVFCPLLAAHYSFASSILPHPVVGGEKTQTTTRHDENTRPRVTLRRALRTPAEKSGLTTTDIGMETNARQCSIMSSLREHRLESSSR